MAQTPDAIQQARAYFFRHATFDRPQPETHPASEQSRIEGCSFAIDFLRLLACTALLQSRASRLHPSLLRSNAAVLGCIVQGQAKTGGQVLSIYSVRRSKVATPFSTRSTVILRHAEVARISGSLQ
jgi:hypothetical protein